MNKVILAISVVVLCGEGAPAQTTINFDGTGAPTRVRIKDLLRERYAYLGVHFWGPEYKKGGAIVDYKSNFGVPAHSGEAFLAFNRNILWMQDPERIVFDSVQRYVEIFASGGWESTVFLMEGYRRGEVVVSNTVNVPAREWGKLAISDNQGFDSVKLTEIGGDDHFVYDDLTLGPSPSTLSLLVLGAVAAGRRRR